MLERVQSVAKGNVLEKYDWVDCWNIAVIDDDPDFCNIMEATTYEPNIKVTTFRDIKDIPNLKNIKNFDGIILDYYLKNENGVQLAEYFSNFFPDIPVVLVSGGLLDQDAEKWPPSIKAFVPKFAGPQRIMDATITVLKGA